MRRARRVNIGDRSLEPVIGIDTASEAAPAQGGLSPEAVATIWRRIKALYRTGAYPAVSFCLRRQGQVLLNRSLGYRRGGGPDDNPGAAAELASPDTPICLFSASKAMTALLVHKLAEEGGIDLDAPVARYLPEFAGGGKRDITVAAVLAHRGGLPLFPTDRHYAGPKTLLDWDACVHLICQASAARYRARPAYHAITSGFILGEIIQRVTGAPLSDYLNSRFRRPLAMHYFCYGLAPDRRPLVANNYVAGPPVRFPFSAIARRVLSAQFAEVVAVSNADYFMDAVIPSGNLYATAEELSRFYQMLLDGGVYNQQRIFAPETIARAVRPVGRTDFDHMLMAPMRYSEGLMLGMNPFGLYGPMTGRAFGHLGFMNILGWADPERDISAGLLVTGKAIFGSHLIALVRALAAIARECR